MELYSENKDYKLYQGNMLDMQEVIEPETIDSIVTDPPYELNFMGKGWDNSGIAFNKDTWKKCYEVLKPGGYLLAFGGSRTFHRIACAIEDVGFEIRDTIMWLYGSGFPKSMDIEKAINKKDGVQFRKKKASGVDFMNTNDDGYNNTEHRLIQEGESSNRAKKWQGWGSCLKPSYEPIIIARKPFKGSLVDNVIENGVGGINIDECRVGTEEQTVSGRFPTNTILTYDETDFDEVCGGFPYTKTGSIKPHINKSNGICNFNTQNKTINYFNGDSGSASRYFYCAKASKKDRDEGLDSFNNETVNDGRQTPIDNPFQRGETPRKNTHPTVKPTELMQYLVRLVTPNNGIALDPFNGSGSTGKAVMYENKERNKNYKYIGIELTEEYLPIAKARIEYVCNLEKEKETQATIFDYI